MSFCLKAHTACRFDDGMLQVEKQPSILERVYIGLPLTSCVNSGNYLTPLSFIFLCTMKLTIVVNRVVMKVEHDCNMKD